MDYINTQNYTITKLKNFTESTRYRFEGPLAFYPNDHFGHQFSLISTVVSSRLTVGMI